MVSVEEFCLFVFLSEELLDHCTKEQLLKTPEQYDIEISDKCLKERVKAILKSNLFEKKVFERRPIGGFTWHHSVSAHNGNRYDI